VAGRNITEDHRVGDTPACAQIVPAHHRGGDVTGRVHAVDDLLVLVENLRVFATARPDVGGETLVT
jgi:hypothetical protein